MRILLVASVLLLFDVSFSHSAHRAVEPPPAPVRPTPPPQPLPGRPPQFVVVSFDGSGGARLWSYWRRIARETHAHFSFFVSGVYLVDWAHRDRYSPPAESRGSSAIGFAPDAAWIAAMRRQIALGCLEGKLMANQVDESSARIESENYRTFWNAFLVSYRGNRAPLSIGMHFETWENWAYDHAVTRFLLRACQLPQVRCASDRELVDWLDAHPEPRLNRG